MQINRRETLHNMLWEFTSSSFVFERYKFAYGPDRIMRSLGNWLTFIVLADSRVLGT